MAPPLPQPPVYQVGHPSAHDVAIWHTCQLNELIDAGSFDAWPATPTSFPPSLGQNERVVARGVFTLSDYGALGDGTYTHDGGFFFATGGLGLAMTAGAMVGRAIGNSARRSAAARDAQARWKQIDAGQLWVSTHGFYFLTNTGQFLPWDFESMHAVQLLAPGTLWFSGQSANGPVSWILESDWAELIFTFWCRVRHLGHEQFGGGAWVPPGWHDRAGAMGLPAVGAADPGPRAILSDPGPEHGRTAGP